MKGWKTLIIFLHIRVALIASSDRFEKILKRIERSLILPPEFAPIAGSENHRNTSSVVFSVGLIANIVPKYYKIFLGTLRNTGFAGDIVLALDKTTGLSNLELCLSYRSIIYQPELECKISDRNIHRDCRIVGTNDPMVPLCMTRYRLYLWWARLYDHHTNILIADFRDVFFQSNPFSYYPEQWAPPVAQLTLFLEATPQKAIYRCIFNSGWIRSCYGEKALDIVKINPVSCSGTSLGSRDGIVIYAFLMMEQLLEASRGRYDLNEEIPSNSRCFVIGMDQGLHNWLLHSGRLRRLMKVKVFSQGEGPVNTIGAFYPGDRALLRLDLEKDWKILKGSVNQRYIANWNNDPSPVVHQYDRFEMIKPRFLENMTALRGILSSTAR